MTVGLLSFGTPAGLLFNFTFTPAFLALGASFKTSVITAGNLLSAACPNIKATINLNVDTDASASGSASPNVVATYTFTQLRNAILANQFTPEMVTFASTFPSVDPGFGPYFVPTASEKTLGFRAGRDAINDGIVVFGSGINPALLVGVALHEISHAMGRINFLPYGFCRFKSAGVYETTWVGTCYFSIDAGATKIADFDTSADTSDWLNGGVQDVALGNPPQDPFSAFYSGNTLQTLSAADIKTLHVLGFW